MWTSSPGGSHTTDVVMPQTLVCIYGFVVGGGRVNVTHTTDVVMPQTLVCICGLVVGGGRANLFSFGYVRNEQVLT